MKIAIIGHKRIPSNEGGIEKVVDKHVERMVALGHQVEVYNRGGRNAQGEKAPRLKSYKGARILTIPTLPGSAEVPLYSLLATLRAAFGHYDVVHYQASGPCMMVPLAKLLGIRRVVASLHGIDSQRAKWGKFASWYLRLGERMAATRADACLVLSQSERDYIQKTYGGKAYLFANGSEKPVLRQPDILRREYGLEKDSYYLSLGRGVPEKGIHFLVEAFRELKTQRKLVIAGGFDPRYKQQLLEIAQGDPRVLFIGFVQGDIIGELYSNAYCYAIPSTLEGMANALLEAMSYGNCCVVSDIPENTSVVGDHAVITRTGDVADLRQALQRLEDHPELVARYRADAAPYILSRYNWDRAVRQMLEIYSENLVDYEQVE